MFVEKAVPCFILVSSLQPSQLTQCLVVRTLKSQLALLNRTQIFRFLEPFNNCLAQNVTFFFSRKVFRLLPR